MSTQNSPFGQPSGFGGFGSAGSSTESAAPVAPEVPSGRSSRTVVIVVAAGVLALGVLGGAAALVMTGDGDAAEVALPPAPVASVEASEPPAVRTPLPTAAVQGRNVFLPLVEDEAAAGGSGDEVVDPVAESGAVATTSPVLPRATAAPLPVPAATQTVVVPGPTATVTQTVPGPTTTTTVDTFTYDLTIAAVADSTSATSDVTFVVNGVTYETVDDAPFAEVFVYNGYDVAGANVLFQFGSTMYALPVTTRLGLGTA